MSRHRIHGFGFDQCKPPFRAATAESLSPQGRSLIRGSGYVASEARGYRCKVQMGGSRSFDIVRVAKQSQDARVHRYGTDAKNCRSESRDDR